MVRVKLTNDPWDPIARQTPGGRGFWGDYAFLVNQDVPECDYFVVCERLFETQTVLCPRERTVFVSWEPPTVTNYHPRFLAQFAAVIAPHRDLPHPNVINRQCGVPWTVGLEQDSPRSRRGTIDYDWLKRNTEFPKTKLMSVVCSAKTMTEGHRQRLRLLERLKAEFGDDLDVFGNGFREVEEKWDVIHPYRYHLVLENCQIPDYWTEKLADAFLGGAFPLYSGCTNIEAYFPLGSLCTIDRADPEAAVRTIRELLARDAYSAAVPMIRAARDLVLDRHNVFPMLTEVLPGLPPGRPVRTQIRPVSHFQESSARRLKAGLKKLVGR